MQHLCRVGDQARQGSAEFEFPSTRPKNKHEDTMIPKVLLTIPDFCAATAMSRTRFYEEVNAGRIKPIKVGLRSVRVPVEQVQAYVNAISQCP